MTDLAGWIEDGAVTTRLRVHGHVTWFADATDNALIFQLIDGDLAVVVKHVRFDDMRGTGQLPGDRQPSDADLRRAMKVATRGLVRAGERHLADFGQGQTWLTGAASGL